MMIVEVIILTSPTTINLIQHSSPIAYDVNCGMQNINDANVIPFNTTCFRKSETGN